MALPTVPFDPTKTVVPQKSYAKFTPTGGSPVNLVGKLANYEQTLETVKREVPGSDNLLRADRIQAIRQSENVKFELEDVKRLLEVFGSLSGIAQGVVEVYITDPNDAAGKVAFYSQSFACTATLDGGINFQAAEFAKGTINFEARQKILWQVDQTV